MVSVQFPRYVIVSVLAVMLSACSSNSTIVDEQIEGPAVEEDMEEVTPPAQESEPEPELDAEEPLPEIDAFSGGLGGGNTDAFPFPAADDAANFENMMGLYSYTTAFELEQLAVLYQAAFLSQGYTQNADTIIPGMAVLSFEGDGQALTVNVTTNADGSNTVSILAGTLQ
jgi:hypothetical protein